MLNNNPTMDRAMAEIRQALGKTSPAPKFGNDAIDYDPGIWDFDKNITRLRMLETEWNAIFERAKEARQNRQQEVDVKRLRSSGELKNGNTIVPRRTIDVNLRRLHAPFMQFVEQPRRAIVLNCVSAKNVRPEILEKDYTTLARYDNYEQAWFRLLDGAQTHGWASMLTLFDPSMPGAFRHKYIAHDRLIFPLKASDIQKCEYVVLYIDTTVSQLKSFIKKNGFDADQVAMVLKIVNKSLYDDNECDDVVTLRLCYYKHNGVVYTCWYHTDCSAWLRKPRPLFMGKQTKQPGVSETPFGPIHRPLQDYEAALPESWIPVQETEYPIDLYIAYDTEEEQIVLKRGRAFYDLQVQSAQTSIWSSFINQLRKSSDVYASPANSKNGGEPNILKKVQLIPGAFYDTKIEWWNMQPPTNIAMIASQALSSENANDTNQTAFTVMNRKDARKTKKEMDLAEETQSTTNTVPLSLWASVYRAVHSRSFDVVLSRARQGKLDAFLTLNAEDEELRQQQEQNREFLLQQTYILRAAGEVDIAERQEKFMQLQQFFPVIAKSPLRNVFLSKMVELVFPDDAEQMKKILETAMPEQQLTNAAVALLSGIIQKYGQMFTPEELQGMTQIIQQAQQSREIAKP